MCTTRFRAWLMPRPLSHALAITLGFFVEVCTALTSRPMQLIFGMWLHIYLYNRFPCLVDGPDPSVMHERSH